MSALRLLTPPSARVEMAKIARNIAVVFNGAMSRLSSSILAFRVAIAAQEGGDVTSILRAAGAPPGAMEGNPPYVDLATERRAWNAMIEATGREDIGLVCGRRLPTQAMGILGYVMANAPTLRVAVEKSCTYQRVMGDSMGMVAERGTKQTKLWLDQWTEWHDPLRHTVDCFMAAIVSWSASNVAGPVAPRQVGFHYDQPSDTSAHENLFAPAVVKFGTDVSFQIFDNEILDQPIIGANRSLFRSFEEKVQRVVGQLDSLDTWADRVRQTIAEHLKGTSPTLEAVSSTLAVSVRTLQLRLCDEGTSFSQILTETKSDLAKEFLKSGDVRNEEIAYLLGYSEQSAFARSFKKWTGHTPTQFRTIVGV